MQPFVCNVISGDTLSPSRLAETELIPGKAALQEESHKKRKYNHFDVS